ncbi:hypothetical protein MN608_03778 [Microdochium nivale]|nr:hypothetical protein MN608_03778 [Microdochium nivale]
MCRSCYVTTFSALSPATDLRGPSSSSSSSHTCKNYNYNTAMSDVPPELIWARMDEKKAQKARMKAAAKAAKHNTISSDSTARAPPTSSSSAASTCSGYTAYSYDKGTSIESPHPDAPKKKSVGQRLKHAFQ